MTAHRTASVFAGFRFPPAVISLAVRWYLRHGLSYRDVEELLAERGIAVDHVTIYRWVQRFTPEFTEAARPCRHAPGDRWFADETYVKVAGAWTYLYRAVDQHGQVIDVLLSDRRDLAAARRFFTRALRAGTVPAEVTTDRAPAYPRVPDELIPSALHTVEQYANNPVEADHGRLKARPRPMRGLKSHRSARILAAGHAFVLNLRRGQYDIATEVPATTGSARHSTTSRSPSEPTRASRSCSDAAQGRHNATVPLIVPGVHSLDEVGPWLAGWAAGRGLCVELLQADGEFSFDAMLRDLAAHADRATARVTAKSIEYPTGQLHLAGAAWPWRAHHPARPDHRSRHRRRFPPGPPEPAMTPTHKTGPRAAHPLRAPWPWATGCCTG